MARWCKSWYASNYPRYRADSIFVRPYLHQNTRCGQVEQIIYRTCLLDCFISFWIRTFMIDIVLVNKTRKKIFRHWLENQTKRLVKKMKLGPRISLSLVVIDRAEMKNLNRSYRKQNKSTDVLSFNLKSNDAVDISGEIFLCLSEAEMIACERRTSLSRAFLWLIIHGILHLAGYQHENTSLKKAKILFDRQDQLACYFHV